MSGQINVTLGIGGRNHVVSVAPEEEAHIRNLAQMIDDRVRRLGLQGQTEARMLLYAALVLADELHAAQSASPPSAPEPVAIPAETGPQIPGELIDHINALADRVEKLAARLEQSGAKS